MTTNNNRPPRGRRSGRQVTEEPLEGVAENFSDRRRFFVPAEREFSEEDVDREEVMADLAAFQEFRETVAPALRAMVEKKVPPEEMIRQFQSLLTARALTIALTSRDQAKSLAAVKDVLDRGLGKAVERRETKHVLEQLKDQELDALLESKLKASGQIEVIEDDDSNEDSGE